MITQRSLGIHRMRPHLAAWLFAVSLGAFSFVACSGSGGGGGGGSSGSDLQIGGWSWSLPSSGSGTATATGTIYNHSSGGKSGSIGLRLRLSTAPYGDGGAYYETARANGLSQLSGGYYRDYTVSDPFSLSSVPSGTHYIVLILAEYTGGSGSGYTIRDGSTSSTTYTISGGGGDDGGGGGGGVTTCGNCPGNLQCSQVVGCLQSCTCYYTINGSDGTSAWYLVNGACYMCAQNGLSPSCSSAAQAAADAATAAIAAGQCF